MLTIGLNNLRLALTKLKFMRKKFENIFVRYQSNETFLTGSSGQYIEDMYQAWLKDPNSVHVSWSSYFNNFAYERPPSLGAAPPQIATMPINKSTSSPTPSPTPVTGDTNKLIQDHLTVSAIIRSYQSRGHLVAQLDPLGIMFQDRTTTISDLFGKPPIKVTRQHKLHETNMDSMFKLPQSTYIGGDQTELPLKEILKRLELVYCRHIGVEYMYINSIEERDWIRRKIELPHVMDLPIDEKKLILGRLTRAAGFESFLARKYKSEKRFGIEGCEVLIPAMKAIIDKSSELGVESFIMSMAHRGRLNVLANVCRQHLYKLFIQFNGLEPADVGSGDVKYHLGTHVERLNRITNKIVKLFVIANPSHLEAAASVAQGRTRAEQFYKGDNEGKTVMSIILHGDAAFSGQGIVYETICLSDLPEYTTRGTIHIVVNNQIGFTTDPRYSRSSLYCSDVARVVHAPIFHVNSDDPESVVYCCKVAAEWRAKFHRDVVIDIVCYRRNGHNETDEPMFTQPLMYKKINGLPPILEKYTKQLISEGAINQEYADQKVAEYNKICEEAFAKASNQTQMKLKDWIDSPWSGFFEGKDMFKVNPTGVKEEILQHIGNKFSSPPPNILGFVIHKGLERILKARKDMINEKLVDWALGEAMAFGTLLKEGYHVRLSGQDVERGTFSHRHHVFHHQTSDKVTYRPLNDLYPDQAHYSVCNSSLSEYGVLGFESGYAMTNPNALILWEAQFGDFCNTAQCIIDQFLSAGQSKWVRQCGIVVLLPHAMEGMGPEHSNCRVERFLQMCDDDPDVLPNYPPNEFAIRQLHDINWIVANCSLPSNFFHLLRRQIYLPFRKPLIHLSPKSLLRLPEARGKFADMIEGTEFKRLIPDENGNEKDVKKLLFCCGKVYYDIKKQQKEKKLENEIKIIRIEQLCPFPYDLVKIECDKSPLAKLCWVQEEHKNTGPWTYMEPRFKTALSGQRPIHYYGRPSSASPAAGAKYIHLKELSEFLKNALEL